MPLRGNCGLCIVRRSALVLIRPAYNGSREVRSSCLNARLRALGVLSGLHRDYHELTHVTDTSYRHHFIPDKK